MNRPRTQININIDLYKFLKDKWTWIISGLILLVIAVILPEPTTDFEIVNNAIQSSNLIFSTMGIIIIAVGIIWWIVDNWDNIQSYFNNLLG